MIFAMFALVLLTFLVGIVAVTARVRSVLTGQVKIKYYRAMSGQTAPDYVMNTTRCFNNLFEVPVLFYVVGVLFVSLQLNSAIALLLAWLFVLLRALQALVHLTYNNVFHRMLLFWAGMIDVLLIWTLLLTELVLSA